MDVGTCRTIQVKALQQGYTKVKVIYNHGKILLEASITIATYDQLIVSTYFCHYTLMPGFSSNISFELTKCKYFVAVLKALCIGKLTAIMKQCSIPSQ